MALGFSPAPVGWMLAAGEEEVGSLMDSGMGFSQMTVRGDLRVCTKHSQTTGPQLGKEDNDTMRRQRGVTKSQCGGIANPVGGVSLCAEVYEGGSW